MTTYKNARRDAAVADEFLSGHAACAFCGHSTEREVLSMNGARCGACFSAYVTGGRRYGPMPTPEQRKAIVQRLKAALLSAAKPGKQWAYAMRDREERGERLSIAQRGAWRQALGQHAKSEAEAA